MWPHVYLLPCPNTRVGCCRPTLGVATAVFAFTITIVVGDYVILQKKIKKTSSFLISRPNFQQMPSFTSRNMINVYKLEKDSEFTASWSELIQLLVFRVTHPILLKCCVIGRDYSLWHPRLRDGCCACQGYIWRQLNPTQVLLII